MDNINSFLNGLDAVGIPMEDRFRTVDLWERTNLLAVQICLQAIGRVASKFDKPTFNFKERVQTPNWH